MNQSKTASTATLSRLFISTGIVTVLLLAPAVAASLAGWLWAPAGGAWVDVALILTDSASFPFAIVTSVILAALFLAVLRVGRPQSVLAFVLLCAIALGCGQGIKSLLKNTFQEPRPYVVWLGQNHALDVQLFYQKMPRDARASWIEKNLTDETLVPPSLRNHWRSETGFSFPSGHTSFVAIWALLGAALLWPAGKRGPRVLCCVIVLWALGVEVTRLTLGMHWSADVATSVLLSWAIVTALVLIWKKFIIKSEPDAHHDSHRVA